MAARLDGLDALRGIAAGAVLWGHLPEYNRAIPTTHGYLAVDFFFMLSGYVMARTYERRFAEGMPALSFVRARYRRFWPTMAIGTLIGLPLLHVYPTGYAIQFAAFGFALLPSPNVLYLFPINVVAWSIFFELVANGVHGVALHRIRTSVLLAGSAGLAAVVAVLAFHFGSLDLGARAQTALVGLPRVLLPYIIGIVLYRAWHDAPPLRISPVITAALLPAAALLSWSWAMDVAFVLIACPLLIAGGLRWNAGGAGIALGALSFPLYAVQVPVMDVTRLAGGSWLLGVTLAIAVAGALAAAPYSMKRMKPFLPVAWTAE